MPGFFVPSHCNTYILTSIWVGNIWCRFISMSRWIFDFFELFFFFPNGLMSVGRKDPPRDCCLYITHDFTLDASRFFKWPGTATLQTFIPKPVDDVPSFAICAVKSNSERFINIHSKDAQRTASCRVPWSKFMSFPFHLVVIVATLPADIQESLWGNHNLWREWGLAGACHSLTHDCQ